MEIMYFCPFVVHLGETLPILLGLGEAWLLKTGKADCSVARILGLGKVVVVIEASSATGEGESLRGALLIVVLTIKLPETDLVLVIERAAIWNTLDFEVDDS